MSEYDIRSFYGEEVIPFLKLCSVLYRSGSKILADEDELKAFITTDEAKRGTDFLRLGAFYEGKLYAAIISNDLTAYFDGNPIKVSGVGGVVSDFNSPFKGAMKEINRKAFEFMRERGQLISHLYPFEENYYRQYGYDISTQAARWNIPMDKVLSTGKGKVVAYDGSEEMQADIKRIHNAFCKDKNLCICNNERDWDAFFKNIAPYITNKISFVHYSESGVADAYMNYSAKPQEGKANSAVVETIWFTDIVALKGMLAYFRTQKSYFDNLILPLPESVDISPIIDSTGGWGTRHTIREVKNIGTSRVVDAEEILKLARYKGEGTVSISITDTYAPWNNDCFTVSFGNETTVTRGGTPDIEMSINSFSAAILGRADMNTLALFDDVKIHNSDNLDKVFYKKTVYIERHF